MYPGYILMSHVPCTPPLLLLGLSQDLVHLSPQLWDFIMCTLAHWYIGHCVPWVHCFWYIGTSLPWYIVMYHVPMYSSTFATWTLCTLGTLLLVHWYIFTLVHCHVPCTHVLLHFCYLDLVKILVHLSPQCTSV